MSVKQESFSALSSLLETVSHSPTHVKETVLRKFFQDFEHYRQSFEDVGNQPSIYPWLRLILPGMDRERKAYGLRERTLAEAYIRALGLDRRNEEVQRLLGAGNDLADRLGPLLHGRCPAVGDLTVGDVNGRLDAIGEGGRAVAARDELVALIERGSPLDLRWLVRIVLKNLRLGVSNRRILQLYHPNAPTLYDGASDLKQMVQLIETKAPDVLETAGGVVVLLTHFIRPMLCQRVELRQVGELLRRDTYWLETKMDGERFQMHWDGTSFRYYSRNGHDYSDAFGRTPDQVGGTLTPMLASLIAPSTRDLILDGEMMVFDRRDLRYRDKCDGTDVKALRPGNANLRPCFCVYDVLYHNGRALTSVPYAERARLLPNVVREQFGFVQHCRRERVRDADHLIELINAAIDAQQEGVVLKREDAPYQPNRRAGTGWYKIKPDYIDGLVVDFDLLVMGGYYNLRRSYVNAFLVGVARSPGVYVSVAKVTMGLGVAEWQQLNQTLRSHWRTESIEGLHCGRVQPDVWIAPCNSIVLQLKGSELVRSDSYGAGFTIRFPRIVTTRADKLPDEVCTLEELEQLGTKAGPGSSPQLDTRKATKLAKRHVTLADLNAPAPEKPSKHGKKRLIAAERLLVPDQRAVSPLPGGMLKGRDVCVMSVDNRTGAPTIETLERLVQRHGGRAVANPSPDTFAIVAGRVTFKVRKYMEAGRWDVVREDWLLRAGLDGRLEPFRPEDILTATEPTRMKLTEQYDRYGDSYTRPTTPTTFGALLRRMKRDADQGPVTHQLTGSETVHAETVLLGVRQATGKRLFRGLSARLYLNRSDRRSGDAEEDETSLSVDAYRAQREMLRFVQHGGHWLRDTEPDAVRYVFVATPVEECAAVEEWIATVTKSDQNDPPKLLRVQWIGRSIEAGRLYDEKDFTFNDS
ncbi:DNA ligase 4-like [Anopheles funestus]|uniref:DNA ligase 4-like n=1 Tax=Anopheles funestus TaxID=62324 RepID=UPI0020C6D1C5|nr:DNA ligase 4-like [Anopheles funestus]XP_049292842.1 DNA ligase 4-like [Anopheles funestus]